MTAQAVPLTWQNEQEHRLKLAVAINGILNGNVNSTGTVTLTANTTTTTVSDLRASGSSVVLFMPQTANAAAESPYVATQTAGSFTITHANAATTDRTFRYLVMG